jgi:transposase-like protein
MKLIRQKVVDTAVEAVGDGGTEGARRATGVSPSPAAAETEVVAKAQRRRFSAEYKRRIVREADRCGGVGDIGALLRREGLYSSLLATWRAARDRGELEGLTPKKRGPKANPPDPRDEQLLEQVRETARWRKRAERAEALVEVQKKVAALLGTPLDDEKP